MFQQFDREDVIVAIACELGQIFLDEGTSANLS